MDATLCEKAGEVLAAARLRAVRLVSVESCTGGLIAAFLTEIAGASDVVEGGFVTYSNQVKTAFVGVPAALIEAHGAVSKQVAIAMAQGGLSHAKADIAVAVTGIAGPDGGTAEKPVGLVHLATACLTASGGARLPVIRHEEARFGAMGRSYIRRATVAKAFDLLLQAIQEHA